MTSMPGESVVTRHVPGAWPDDNGAQAQATLTAAAHHVCLRLLPLSASNALGSREFAIALEGSVPAVLELSVLLPFGKSEVSLRVPAGAEDAGEALVNRIRDQALAMAPRREGASTADTGAPADDLPF